MKKILKVFLVFGICFFNFNIHEAKFQVKQVQAMNSNTTSPKKNKYLKKTNEDKNKLNEQQPLIRNYGAKNKIRYEVIDEIIPIGNVPENTSPVNLSTSSNDNKSQKKQDEYNDTKRDEHLTLLKYYKIKNKLQGRVINEVYRLDNITDSNSPTSANSSSSTNSFEKIMRNLALSPRAFNENNYIRSPRNTGRIETMNEKNMKLRTIRRIKSQDFEYLPINKNQTKPSK